MVTIKQLLQDAQSNIAEALELLRDQGENAEVRGFPPPSPAMPPTPPQPPTEPADPNPDNPLRRRDEN